MYPEALQYVKKVEFLTDDPTQLCFTGFIYAMAGNDKKALSILKNSLKLIPKNEVDPVSIAIIYAGLGKKEKVFEWLNRAYEIKSGHLIYLKAFQSELFKDIGSDPRFIELLNKIGFDTG